MRDLNIDFMDLYKSVDRFIRDAYSSSEGVSEYIRQMENNEINGKRYVSTWAADYDRLDHLRWIRNQLSHEVGFDADICEESDYHWLETFRNRLYSANDPMAVLYRAEKAEQKKLAEEQRRRQAQAHEQQRKTDSKNIPAQQTRESTKHKTLWQRIKSFFSGK